MSEYSTPNALADQSPQRGLPDTEQSRFVNERPRRRSVLLVPRLLDMANLQQHVQVHVQRDGDELEDDEGERREIRIERNNNNNANDDNGNEVRGRAHGLRRRTLTRGARVPPEIPDFELRP